VLERLAGAALIAREAAAQLPTDLGDLVATGYRSRLDAGQHLALVPGGPRPAGAQAMLYVHRACAPGDVFGSRACDCGRRLTAMRERIAASGAGALVYLDGGDAWRHLDPDALRDADLTCEQAAVAAQIAADQGFASVVSAPASSRLQAALAARGIHVVNGPLAVHEEVA